MIVSLEAQFEAQKESQNIVHQDQQAFLHKLNHLKHIMEETATNYAGTEMSLWEFANLQLDYHMTGETHTVKVTDKRNLSLLMEQVLEVEGDLIKVVSEAPNLKEKFDKFFHLKLFGSFEQMRVEMEIRYKAENVFLTTSDKTKLHGYWVPCAQVIKEQQEEYEGDIPDDDEDYEGTKMHKKSN